MIKSVNIENFKKIKSKKFRLRNLNILMGLNNSGKSTFIESILAYHYDKDVRYDRVIKEDENYSIINIEFENKDSHIIKFNKYNIPKIYFDGDNTFKCLDDKYINYHISNKFDNIIEFDNHLIHPKSIINGNLKSKDRTISNQINFWLKDVNMNINSGTSITGTEFHILSIIVELFSALPGQIIIIKNIENGVHPKLQAILGKMIALTAMNNVQIIIETHSDHILNAIRVAIKVNPTFKDDVILFFFKERITKNETYSEVSDIKIDRRGTLSYYPENLLDEWNNQLCRLI